MMMYCMCDEKCFGNAAAANSSSFHAPSDDCSDVCCAPHFERLYLVQATNALWVASSPGLKYANVKDKGFVAVKVRHRVFCVDTS